MKEGELLRRLIRDSEMTQQEFADKLAVSRVYLVQLFNKDVLPVRIKDDTELLLGVRIDDMEHVNERTNQKNTTKDNSENHSKEVELLKEIIKSKDEMIEVLKDQLKKLKKLNR